MTVREYRLELAWSISELARRAGTTTKTIRRIESGQPVNDYTVAAVANAVSQALGRRVTIYDFNLIHENVIDSTCNV